MTCNMDSLLTSVDVLVDDENKIVTYKTLCAEFAISTTEAKRCLEKYASGKDDLTKTFVVSGRNDKGICMTITRDKDLEALKLKLKKVFAVSIYSVQKCIVKDSSMLYATDSTISQDLLPYSSIQYAGAQKLESQPQAPHQGEEVASIISKKKDDPSPKQQSKNTFFKTTKKAESSTKPKEDSAKHHEVKQEKTVPKPSTKSHTKKGGMDMFVSKTKTDPFAASKKSKAGKSSVTTTKKAPAMVKEEEECREEDNVALDDDLDSFSTKLTKKTSPEKKKIKEEKKEPEKTVKEKKTTQHKRKSSSTKPSTKRRRIQQISSSSESESEAEEERIPEPSPPPPPMEVEEEPTATVENKETKATKSHGKKKVIKTRTYVDEEGDMVTEKYFVYESCSDDDFKTKPTKTEGSEKENKDAKKKSTAKTIKMAKKTKQPTLQSFFLSNQKKK